MISPFGFGSGLAQVVFEGSADGANESPRVGEDGGGRGRGTWGE